MDAPLTRRDRLRRVVLVCASFVRNLAFYRVGQAAGSQHAASHPQASFWRQANGNFLDICVLDWCKLLGDRKAEHGWRKIVSDPPTFEAGLLAHLGMTAAEFEIVVEAIRRYRDKFVAHLDSERVMDIPILSAAQAAVWFYHEHVSLYEAGPGDLANLPDTADKVARGYAQCVEEAERVYRWAEVPVS